MKHFYTLLLLLISTATFAQIPAGYYSTATGSGYTLKTQLKKIIDDMDDPEISNTIEEEHNPQSYNALDGFNATYERDFYYDAGQNNTILDIYSENPSGNDPYNFTPTTDECGNYNNEGDCYNKEHIIPQSVFNSQAPMQSDAHHLLPTDGRVNGFRSNYPFGQVNNAQLVNQSGITNPTLNGSKLGNNLNSGYSAGYTGIVFEPIDEFKGDIARIYFYFATRYEDQISSWSDYDMFDGSSDKVFDDTFLSILTTWHNNDPVSQKEIDRNNNIYYNHQNNRNPFIDHPEYVNLIWNPTPDTEAPTDPTNLIASNPTDNTIDLNWTASTDNITVVSYDIYIDGINSFNSLTNSFTVPGLTPETTYCFTVKAKDAAGNESDFSNQSCETTLEGGSTGSECASETFTNIPTENAGTYLDRTWTGDNSAQWTATNARTDQTINGASITLDNRDVGDDAVLTSPIVSSGIGNLTVTTQRKFSGTDSSLNLYVNGVFKGTIPYSGTVQTTTIPNINVEGNVTIVISEEAPGNRVAIDNLSWTCYSSLSNEEFSQETFNIYPNPVSNQLNIQLNSTEKTQIEIYNILGKRVLTKTIHQSQTIQLDNLNSGVYILKLTQNNSTISKKLIKR